EQGDGGIPVSLQHLQAGSGTETGDEEIRSAAFYSEQVALVEQCLGLGDPSLFVEQFPEHGSGEAPSVGVDPAVAPCSAQRCAEVLLGRGDVESFVRGDTAQALTVDRCEGPAGLAV